MKSSINVLASRKVKAPAHTGEGSYRIHLPGVGTFGSYPTIEAAQTAIYYLPIDSRRRATIHRAKPRRA